MKLKLEVRGLVAEGDPPSTVTLDGASLRRKITVTAEGTTLTVSFTGKIGSEITVTIREFRKCQDGEFTVRVWEVNGTDRLITATHKQEVENSVSILRITFSTLKE